MDLLKYPKELTNNRQQIEAAFVFTLWKEPDLFGEYTVISQNPKNELITTPDGKFYYLLGLKMFEKGYRNYDEITVSSYLQDYPEVKKEFDIKGGMATVKELTSLVHEDNIDGYYDNLVKANILLKLYDKGFDVLGNIDKFKEMTSEDVYDFFDYQLNSVAIESNHNFEIEDLLIDDEFLAECERGDAQGLSYKKYTPIMNSMTMGIPLGELFMIGGFSGVGKALAVTEPIITPNGAVPMGDIKLGDYVIGEDGKKTKVIGVFPQGKRDAYRVTFFCGYSVICDREHLWKYKYNGSEWRVNTLGEMLEMYGDSIDKVTIPESPLIEDFLGMDYEERLAELNNFKGKIGNKFSSDDPDELSRIKQICFSLGFRVIKDDDNTIEIFYKDSIPMHIMNVEKLDEQVEMQCIMVDNESHTYLCGDFIVTHNSSFVFENMILPLTMDNIKCTIISNEQRSKDFKLLLLVHVLTRDLGYYGLTRRKLKAGGFTDEQKEMLDKARNIIAEKYSDIKFVKLFDNDMDKVKKVIRKQAKVGHQVFMFDTMKSEDQIDEAMWQQLLIHSRKLFQLASKENISIICTYQLALSKLNTRYLDASCLSNAKQIKEVFSEMVYFRPLADDEYDGERYAVEPTRLEKDEEGKFTGRKIHMPLTDKDKRYLIAFIDKTRNGEDKKQILYEFNGAYNHWKEIGNCKVLNTYN